jgi:hypothetical protein
MVFATGILTNSIAGDITVVGAVIGMFATIIKLQLDQKKLQSEAKKERKEEIRSVVSELINNSPDKVVVSPQPLIVEMRKEFIERAEYERVLGDLARRVGVLEQWREADKRELHGLIAAIPGQVIALIGDANRMFAGGRS